MLALKRTLTAQLLALLTMWGGTPADAQTEIPVLGLGILTVEAHQKAIRTTPDQRDILQPGLHFYNTRTTTIAVYDVFYEQTHRISDALTIDDCTRDIIVIYTIGDVFAFHDSGGELALPAHVDAFVRQAMDDSDLAFGNPLTEALAKLYEALNQEVTNVFNILRIKADVADCPSSAPRRIRQSAPLLLPDLPAPAQAQHETQIAAFEARTQDGEIVLIDGALLRFDIADDQAMKNCVGSAGMSMAERVAQTSMITAQREWINAVDLASLPAVLAGWAALSPQATVGSMASCGLLAKGLDFRDASVSHIVVIECSEQPERTECQQ